MRVPLSIAVGSALALGCGPIGDCPDAGGDDGAVDTMPIGAGCTPATPEEPANGTSAPSGVVIPGGARSRETAEAEHAMAMFHQELAAIRPLETGGALETDHSGVLEGLPPMAPPTSGEGDDTVTPPSEPDPHGADPIDGREDTTEPPAPPELRGPHEPELPEDREDHHAIE